MIEGLRVCVVGFGNMGRALVDGWIRAGLPAHQIAVTDVHESSLSAAREVGLSVGQDLAAFAKFEVCVLSVKPQQIESAILENLGVLERSDVVMSIAAGISLNDLESKLIEDQAIVRAMPNTPAAVGRGVTALYGNSFVSQKSRNACAALTDAVGSTHWLSDESWFDPVTALSGSGPAYVFLFIESLRAAGIAHGLPPQLANDLALQTIAGAATYAEITGIAVDQLREQVTSPGGTTAAALQVLMSGDKLEELIAEAVAAAAKRSRELAGS